MEARPAVMESWHATAMSPIGLKYSWKYHCPSRYVAKDPGDLLKAASSTCMKVRHCLLESLWLL